MSFIISLNGKGGTGKTTISALVIDELLRAGCDSLLAVDADPAMTLHLALGIPEPAATVATVADSVRFDAETVRNLPQGMTRGGYVWAQMKEREVLTSHPLNGRTAKVDYLALGQRAARGCYCSINSTLARVLDGLVEGYRAVVIDNEAGLEHLNRHRLTRADLFLVVVTPGRASLEVGHRVASTAREMGMQIERLGLVANRGAGVDQDDGQDWWAILPGSSSLQTLERRNRPAVALPKDSALRQTMRRALEGVIESVCV